MARQSFRLSHSEPPSCLEDDEIDLPCPECPFWDRSPCPIATDPEYRSFIGWQGEQRAEYEARRDEKLDQLSKLLSMHGLPLHWEVLAAIAMEQRPDLFTSPKSVLLLMSWHPEAFEALGAGVYRVASD